MELLERIAVLETQMSSLLSRIEHIDLCVDSLKRTIWQAAGGLTVVILLVQLVLGVR